MQETAARTADIKFRNATLTREVAEIAVVEYREGIAKIEEAKLQGEVTLAEKELVRYRAQAEDSRLRLAKIKELSTGTDEDVALVKSYQFKLSEARNREINANNGVDRIRPNAQAKLKLLREHTIPATIKELESEVLKARAEELANKALLESEKSKQSRLEALIGDVGRKAAANPVREALTRAYGLVAKVRAELPKFAKNEAIEPDLSKSITSLLSELESLIEQTETQFARARVDHLKAAFHGGAAVPSSAVIQTAPPAELTGAALGIRQRLKECHGWIVRFGEPLLESIRSNQREGSDPAVLALRVDAAKLARQSAVLARERAAEELSTYRQVTFPQTLAACERDVAQTEDDVRTAINNANQWDAISRRDENLPVNSASSLDQQYSIESGRVGFELALQGRRFALEQAQLKLKVLKEYEKDKETKRLQAAVEKTIAEDFASKAELVKLVGELNRSRRPKPQPSDSEKQSLALIEEAFKIDETLRGKLAQLGKDVKIDAQLQKEILESTKQLEAIANQADAESSLERFGTLKKVFGRATPRNSPPQDARRELPASPSERARFVNDVERRIRNCHDRVTAIGAWLLAIMKAPNSLRDILTEAQIRTKNADSEFKDALLAREVAEIGIVEYREGIAKQEEATIAGEVKLAESELGRAKDLPVIGKERLAKIKELSKGTAADALLQKLYENRIADAERRVPAAQLAFDRVQTKMKLFRDHTVSTQIKKLESATLKARADELTKRAIFEKEKSTESRLEAEIANFARVVPPDQLREALTRAFGLDEKIQAELVRITNDGAVDTGLAATITGLVSELEALVDQTEAYAAELRVERLKVSNRGDFVQTHALVPAAVPTELTRFVGEIRHRLKECHALMAGLGEPIQAEIRKRRSEDRDPAILAIRIDAAKAAMKSALLARQCAETDLATYKDVAFPQTLAANKREAALPENDLSAALESRDSWDKQLQQQQALPVDSASGLDRRYSIESHRESAELDLKRARFALEQAAQQLKVLTEFEKDRQTMEKRSEIEKAISEEKGSEASLLLAESELKRWRRLNAEPPELEKHVLAMLEQAFKLDKRIRGKLVQLTENGKIDVGLQKEIADSTNELEAVLDRADAESALARFGALKQQNGRGVGR